MNRSELAASLHDDLTDDANYGCGGMPSQSAEITLAGRTLRLTIRQEEESPIGRWLDEPGRHYDDCYGTFAWRDRSGCTGDPSERPAEFDGRARVIHGDSRGQFIDGQVWWQPPADVDDEAAKRIYDDIMDYQHWGWTHVTIGIEFGDADERMGWVQYDPFDKAEGGRRESALLIIAEMLDEVGVTDNLLAVLDRFPGMAEAVIC